MQPHEQPGESIEQTLTEVRHSQAAAREQDAIGQRVVDVAGDQQSVDFVVGVAFGDDSDDLGGRHPASPSRAAAVRARPDDLEAL